jgi:hypothetical protein
MTSLQKYLLAAACLAATTAHLPRPAHANSFTDFAEDEDTCRQAGTAAINGATGPTAAHRYDAAHARCMDAKFRTRIMEAYRDAAPPPYPTGTPHSFDDPDAFYSIPYATPGYGYDGFSP